MKYFEKIIELSKSNKRVSNEALFIYYNLSVLEGEYAIKNKEILEKTSVLNENILLSDVIDENYYTIEEYEKFYEILLNNTKNINETIINPTEELIYNKNEIYKEFDNYKQNNLFIDDEEYNQFKIYLINIRIAEIDEYLECNLKSKFDLDECLIELEKIKGFSNEYSSLIVEILKEKANYLQFKINKRLKTSIENDIEFKYYKKLHNDSQNHHKGSDPSLYPVSKINEYVKKLEEKTINSQEIHFLNKLITKTNKPISSVLELFDKIIGYLDNIDNISSDFEKISKISLKNLVENTKHKIKLENEEKNNFIHLLEFYNTHANINSFELLVDNESNYPDFRNFENKIDFLNKFSDYVIKNQIVFKNNLSKKDLLEKTYEIYENTLNSFEIKSNYASHYEYNPVYLEEKDCICQITLENPLKFVEFIDSNNFQIEISGLNLFLDSSYILPINYQRLKDIAKSKKLFLESKFEFLYHRIDLETKQAEFESKVKESEFKAIQVLAMFVTITTFVLINVKIYDNKTGWQSISLLLGMSGIFVMFNLFFHMIVMSQSYDKEIVLNWKIPQIKSLFNNPIKTSPRVMLFLLSLFLILSSIFIMLFFNDEPLLEKVDKRVIKFEKTQKKNTENIIKKETKEQILKQQILEKRIDSIEKKINQTP